jgi:ABC-type multidrug transport system ATPase subunit
MSVALLLLQFVDVKHTVAIESRFSWSAKRPFQFKRQSAMEKEILHGITGSVMPGEVLAIMGPSGSGKTTFLNLMGGRALRGTSGNITYNDIKYSKALKRRYNTHVHSPPNSLANSI